ncbi:MAG: hypothetical protein ACYTGZ_16195 [Planctomycetota bacterium]
MILHQSATPRILGFARILVFSLWLVNLHLIALLDFADLPLAIHEPRGVMQFLPDAASAAMHGAGFLLGFKVLVTAGLVWLILGLPGYTRVAIATCVLLTLFDGIVVGFGPMTHKKFGILYAAWVLAFFPAADALAVAAPRSEPRRSAQYVLPMVVITMALMTVYSFVGATRITTAGLETYFGDTLRARFLDRCLEPNPTGFTLGITIAETPRLMQLSNVGYLAVTVLELLSPLCLFHNWFRRIWLAVMIPFHVLVPLTMNIVFWDNTILLLFFGIDWTGQCRDPSRRDRTSPEAPVRTAPSAPFGEP